MDGDIMNDQQKRAAGWKPISEKDNEIGPFIYWFEGLGWYKLSDSQSSILCASWEEMS